VRKAPVTSAALAAALLVLAVPAESQARSRQRGSVSKRAPRASVQVSESFAAPRPEALSERGLLRGGPVARTRRPRAASSRKPRIIHQVDNGEVVLDSVEVVAAEAHGPRPPDSAAVVAVALPAEPHNYPEAPCQPVDPPVIEAHVHVADADTPEKADAEDVVPRHDASRITKIARRLSSFFRPKSAKARVKPRDVDLPELLAANFLIPVEGVDRARLRDSFLDSRGQYARHLAIDIGAPRGTPILATSDGEIVKLTREARGGITIYQKDSSGRYLFFYCHLSRYARGLSVGRKVAKGEVIGYVGATGHVIGGPHLHFSITRLPEDDDNLREGLAINPYLLFLAGVP
jgi:murein DD-endopeptidase MepM/ murein hydrolase activator NlpD